MIPSSTLLAVSAERSARVNHCRTPMKFTRSEESHVWWFLYWIQIDNSTNVRTLVFLFSNRYNIKPSRRSFWSSWLRCGSTGFTLWPSPMKNHTSLIVSNKNKIQGMNQLDCVVFQESQLITEHFHLYKLAPIISSCSFFSPPSEDPCRQCKPSHTSSCLSPCCTLRWPSVERTPSYTGP